MRFENRCTQKFVEVYLNSIKLDDFITGMAQPKLNKAMLDSIPIPHPDVPEQQRIADCLSSLDDLIRAQAQKIEALKAHKKRPHAAAIPGPRKGSPMTELLLYTTEDGRNRIRLRTEQNTVWLTQLEMAELFDTTKQSISLHLKNIFADGELEPSATVKESLTVQIEGSREVQRPLSLYNLDAILAVGYRVRSPRGVAV